MCVGQHGARQSKGQDHFLFHRFEDIRSEQTTTREA
uniref:Uncharacterized protein n=1 Tax=Anopheles arabiensis TaxID=7173 RepID=A0A182I705_ANOAR